LRSASQIEWREREQPEGRHSLFGAVRFVSPDRAVIFQSLLCCVSESSTRIAEDLPNLVVVGA